MSSEWLKQCRGPGLSFESGAVEVSFVDGRKHRVRLEEVDGALMLAAVVVGAARAAEAEANEIVVWRRNHGTRFTGFRFDSRGRIVGEAFMPLAGLTAEAVRFRVRMVAEECDQFERALTGVDVE